MNELAFVDYAGHMTRARVLRHASRESCIISARATCAVLNRLGFRAMPVTVGVLNMNAYTHEHLMVKGLPHDENDDKLFTVGVEHQYTPDDEKWSDNGWWAGHLCVMVNNRYFMDPSADQMSWPERGVTLSPFTIEVKNPEAFLYDGEELVIDSITGQVSYYKAFLDDTAYMMSSDWTETTPGQAYYETVVPGVVDLLETCRSAGALGHKIPLPDAISLRPDRPVTLEQVANARKGFDELEATAKRLGEDLGPAALRAREHLRQTEAVLKAASLPSSS